MKNNIVAVVGGGSAGVMAALRVVLNNDHCLLFPGTPQDKKKSRAFWVSKIENMPGYEHYKKGIEHPNKETLEWIAGSEFASNLETFKNTGIVSIKKLDDGRFELTDSKDEKHQADFVILATGIMDVQPHINGDIEDVFPYANKQSIDYCLRCDGHHIKNKSTAIIGHGNGAAWVAIMLSERYCCGSMSILTNGEKPEFTDETKKLIELYKIDVYESAIDEIIGDPKAGKLEGFKLHDGTMIPVEISFVSLGSIVYNELAKELGAEIDDRGYVLTNEKGETNIENLYVAGDLRANAMKQVYTAWNHSVLSADDINSKIRQAKRQRLLSDAN